MSRLRLVINADDFGYSQERDEGIVQCIQSRLVTSCSLLPNGLTAKTAAASVISLASDFDVSLGSTNFCKIFFNLTMVIFKNKLYGTTISIDWSTRKK